MVGTVVKHRFYANNRVCSQRPAENGFLDAFFHCRKIILRHGAADYDLIKFIRFFQIAGRLKRHLDMPVLSMAAGLLLILVFHIRFLADGFAERNFWFGKFHFDFVFRQQFADNNLKMLIAHAIQKSLPVFTVVYTL